MGAPIYDRVWGYAEEFFLNFNVEISVLCVFYKGEMGDNINFQHSRERQLSPLASVCGRP